MAAQDRGRQDPEPVRHSLVALLKRKLELGHLGNDAQLKLAAENPQLWKDVRNEPLPS